MLILCVLKTLKRLPAGIEGNKTSKRLAKQLMNAGGSFILSYYLSLISILFSFHLILLHIFKK